MKKYKFMVMTHIAVTANQIIVAANDEDALKQFKQYKGTDLNWLEWLLLFGNKTIIRDYVVEFGDNPRSRTGRAVMKGVKSGKWGVPPEFAGTKNNNWITRAIESADSEINSILKEATK